ncbi:ATP-dependent helicase [Candidatus Woesearchaeota archaeon]|nr:ATP-dependent helicase [Candidatus Woesearchaeota archaeon]
MIEVMKKPYKKEKVEKILNPIVKKWFFSRFKQFSLPQLYGVMEIHSRNNILVSAPTGATKTLTAFLAILNELVDSAEKGILEDKIYAVYISPLKALNNDIQKNLVEPLKEIEEIAGKSLGIRVAVRTGDTTQYEKTKMLKNPPHILITTPESLAIVLSSIKFIEHLQDVQYCIIDEIHALADSKRGVHLSLSVERLARMASHMSRIGLSATVAPIEEIAKFLVGFKDGKPNSCKIVDVQFIKELDLKVLSPLKDMINTSPDEIHNAMYSLIDNLIQTHKTTLIFTNTRAATERVVDHLKNKFPKSYTENAENLENSGSSSQARAIAAHHGSLSKEHRLNVEERLRQGKLKCVVCSTSLELGIDIGYIDLVVLLSSPKSVARALQRIGRSGHKLHESAKGRLIVLDRDDLVECAVLLKSAIEKKIDKLHIPTNCLDVLAQQIIGIVLEGKISINDLFKLVKQSYCYKDLSKKDFTQIIDYLAGKYISLEDRHVYAKIWYDEETGMIGRKGKMTRVIYMTNIGTIPDESFILVKIGEQTIGKLDEAFVEKLKPGDVFVLGGDTYTFKFSRGMVVQVQASAQRPPTVPRWFSEMLPLSFDLSNNIGRFRKLINEKFCAGKSKKEIIDFVLDYLYVDKNAAEAIYQYFFEQYNFSEVPSNTRIIVEHTKDIRGSAIVFHTLFGRRVNDCLSRAVAFAISRTQHKDVEIGISDNGFYVRSDKKFDLMAAFKRIKSKELRKVMEFAIERTEVMKRRFRHCASRALMILRNYKGRRKRVGRQQVGSMILMSALKRIDQDFSILKEARREVLEDLMDIENTAKIIKGIENKKIKFEEIQTSMPSPFAFNLIVQGYTDILKMEDRIEFLKRMHQNVLAKISLKK